MIYLVCGTGSSNQLQFCRTPSEVSRKRIAASLLVILCAASTIQSSQVPRRDRWVAVWTASVHGAYPSGNPVAQPVLDRVFESPDRGAHDQTFRLIVRPAAWGAQARLRF